MSKRVNLSTKQKLDLISCVEKGEIKKDVAIKFKVGYSTLCAVLKRKDKLMDTLCPDMKRSTKTKFQSVSLWFNEIRSKNIPVNGEIVKMKAKDFADQLGVVGFNASNGWLDKFKITTFYYLSVFIETYLPIYQNATSPYQKFYISETLYNRDFARSLAF